MTEDRFLCIKLMTKVSEELEAAGFKHVVARHHIDPEWRKRYRPLRPELEPIAWTINISERILPLQEIKALIEICERNNLTIWWNTWGSDSEEGPALSLKIGTNQRTATAYTTP